MESIKTKIIGKSFSYKISGETGVNYRINYFVLGENNTYFSGEIEGVIDNSESWLKKDFDFLLLNVGITEVEFFEEEKIGKKPVRSEFKRPSFAAVKTFATGLLLGNLTLFASTNVDSEMNKPTSFDSFKEQPVSDKGEFNPYL